ncbi:MAG: hypothetical protein Fur0037_18160 [Planctomycetota bacterium]
MEPSRPTTHSDRMPKDICPALMMKQMLTHSLDEPMALPRPSPGDGYYWCTRTCRPVGPDDELVHPSECRPFRACYDGPAA